MSARSPSSPTSSEKLSEALRLLDEAALDKKDEITGLINEKFQNLKSTFSDFEPRTRETLRDLSDTARAAGRIAKKRTEEVVHQVDEDVHHRPWMYISGAAVAGIVLGFLMGKK